MSNGLASLKYKLVLQVGAPTGYLARCLDNKEADFFPIIDASRTFADVLAAGPAKSFPSMLDASKYIYGCMRRSPNAQYAIFATHVPSNPVCYIEGDFTGLRTTLFSSDSGIESSLLIPNMRATPASHMNNFPKAVSDTTKTMDLFDQMKAKIKKELPNHEDGPDPDDADPPRKHGNFDGKVGVQSASDYLKKYKNRGAVVA